MAYTPKKLILILICLMAGLMTAGAQTMSVPEGVSFTIRYFDKEIYYPETPILIKAEILNTSAEAYRFQIADRRAFNFDFQVFTLSNRRLEYADEYITTRRSNQPIFFRETVLGPGEEYAFVMNLKDYIKIEEPGTYYVDATFLPFISTTVRPVGNPGRSNRLTLSIRPGDDPYSLEIVREEEREETLQRMDLGPDEVVKFTLESLQQEEMENFFLYLDLQSLLLEDQGRRRRFTALSEENRKQELSRYREDILEGRTEYNLMERPNSFDILRTNYTPREGTVLVREEFQYQDIREIKEYTYYLEHRENIWYITRYEIQNAGSR